MALLRDDSWKDDLLLREDLAKYVRQLMKRAEILSFVRRDFPHYAWSTRTLDDVNVSVEEVKDAVQEELEGPGALLGYRAMQKKIRQEHFLNVPRHLVHDVIFDLDPDGLDARQPGFKKKKPKGNFITKGPIQ